MANDEVVVGADVTAFVRAMEQAQRAFNEASGKIKGDAQVLGSVLARLKQTGDIDKLFQSLERRGTKSGFFADLTRDLQALNRQLQETTTAIERVQRVAAKDVRPPVSTFSPAISPSGARTPGLLFGGAQTPGGLRGALDVYGTGPNPAVAAAQAARKRADERSRIENAINRSLQRELEDIEKVRANPRYGSPNAFVNERRERQQFLRNQLYGPDAERSGTLASRSVREAAESASRALRGEQDLDASRRRLKASLDRYSASLLRAAEAARQNAADRAVLDRLNNARYGGASGMGPGGYGGYGGTGGPASGVPANGGFFGNFRQGFNQSRGADNFAQRAGQVAGTSLLYGGAYQVLRGIRDTLQKSVQEAVAFQQSITELAIATDQSRSEATKLARNLQTEANQYGFSGSQGTRAGTKALGVFRALDTGQANQGAVARTAARSVLQQSFLTGKDVDDLTSNIAAISQAFELGAEQIGRITDTTAFFEKQFGIAIGSLQDSLPAIASLAKQTGFSLEEAAGLAAAVQSRQASSPAASSGFLSQILTREGEGTVQKIFDEFNIVGDTFRDRFAALATILPQLSDLQRGRVAATFGRGRSQSAAIGLLEELPRIFDLSKRAQGPEALGLNDRQARLRLNDIGGQLAQLGGSFRGLSTEIGRSGLIDALGGAALGLRGFAQTTSNTLEIWNSMPRVLKDAVIAIGAYTLAARAGATSLLAGRFVGALATRNPSLAVLGGQGGARAGLGAIALSQGYGAAARAGGSAALGALGISPVVAGILAVGVSAGILKGSFDSLHESARRASDALITASDIDTSNAESVSAAIDNLTKARDDRKNVTGIADRLFGGGSRADDLSAIDSRIRLLNEVNQSLEAQAKSVNKSPTAGGAFGDLSEGSVARGFETLERKGFSAAESIALLNRALDENTRTTEDAKAIFDADTASKKLGATVSSAFTGVNFAKEGLTNYRGPSPGLNAGILNPFKGYSDLSKLVGGTLNEKDYNDITDAIVKNVTPKQDEIVTMIKEKLDKAAPGGISVDEDRDIAQSIVDKFSGADTLKGEFGGSQVEAAKALYVRDLSKLIDSYTASVRAGGSEGIKEASQFYLNIDEITKNDARAIQDAGAGGNSNATKSAIRAAIANLRRAIDERGTNGYANLQTQLEEKQRELAKIEIDQALDATRAGLTRGTVSGADILRGALGNLRTAVQKAGQAGDLDRLRELLVNANKATIEIARRAYKKYIEAKYAEDLANAENGHEIDYINGKIAEDTKAFEPVVTSAAAASDTRAQIAAAQSAAAALKTSSQNDDLQAELARAAADLDALRATPGASPVAIADAVGRVNAAEAAIAESKKKEATALLKDLLGARVGGALAEAISAQRDAEAALAAAKGDAAAINAATIQKLQADRQRAEAERAFRSNQRRLRLDSTNPAQVAREDARAARETLQEDRARFRGADSDGGRRITRPERDVLNTDRIAADTARNNAKQTAFQQNLTAAQTAENLGRISHAAFLKYLKTQETVIKQQMRGMKKTSEGYFQAQTNLDQILGLEQEAADALNAQFNLGNISLPTPYEVRRFVQQSVNPVGTQSSGPVNGNAVTFVFNGYETDELVQKIGSIVGNGGTYTVSGY